MPVTRSPDAQSGTRWLQAQSEFAKTKTLQQQRRFLPVFECRDELLHLIRENQVVVVVGETGSGKTTQVRACLLWHACRVTPEFSGVQLDTPGSKSGLVGAWSCASDSMASKSLVASRCQAKEDWRGRGAAA